MQDNSGLEKRISTAQWILERNLAWIAAAEVKVGVVVSLNIAMLGGLSAAFGAAQQKPAISIASTLIAAALSFTALICCALCVFPRVDGPVRSLLFFGRIAKEHRFDYVNALKTTTAEQILADWAEQIHRNADIALIKHTWVKKAMFFSFFCTPSWALSIYLLTKF
ncbi:Pycsar system effector family protein [Burkholderia ubonensis]|uniref:Pycsar system effector family protein n=1 Tax=Burkholderia ubonensis TaxID=101571 RepID=UPI0012F9A43F|nr:Pycsar system effector family protein [Burkholderia ubonensis]